MRRFPSFVALVSLCGMQPRSKITHEFYRVNLLSENLFIYMPKTQGGQQNQQTANSLSSIYLLTELSSSCNPYTLWIPYNSGTTQIFNIFNRQKF
mmetsp:Transcript_34681/g.49229  ORF Transcript_34681/g.49229 Transcript_34681/m.49229 type:complete len:95 (+) Transcript_34681:150-434(+)